MSAATGLTTPSQEFAAYCQSEMERRRNSGEPFDEEAYLAAMELALTKLRILEDEGLA
jgi:hypothetical protein